MRRCVYCSKELKHKTKDNLCSRCRANRNQYQRNFKKCHITIVKNN